MKRRTIIRDRTGEGYVDVAISLILIFVIVAGIFSLFPIYTTYQSLNRGDAGWQGCGNRPALG